MSRSKRIKEMKAGIAYYHVMSRTSNRQFLFSSAEIKDELVSALLRAAVFSGIEIEAYAAMDNHFHAIVKVTRTEADIASMGSVPSGDDGDASSATESAGKMQAHSSSEAGSVRGGSRSLQADVDFEMGTDLSEEKISEAELLRRVEVLKGEKARQLLENEWRELRESGLCARLKQEQNRLRARMNDVSEFVKTFKETFDRIYKQKREYCGSIWSGRFTSTLIEDGEYLARCRKYVFFNPVRAGIVSRAAEYRWVYDRNMSEVGGSERSVPEAWLMRRVAQIGAGKVFGSEAFVKRVVFGLGHLFPSRRMAARPVGEIGFATHGWKLASRSEAVVSLSKNCAAKTVAA